MSTPVYGVGDVVYLLESAALGFIESYTIAQVHQATDGNWYYTISVAPRPPLGVATYGDRITLKRATTFELAEAELCAYCQAVDLAYANAQRTLTALAKLKSQCESGTQ